MADETLIELEPDRLGPRGDAAARDADGKPIYVAGAIPGERVLARVYKTGHVCTGTDVVDVKAANLPLVTVTPRPVAVGPARS